MSGSERNRGNETVWYDLVDPATDSVVGQVTRDGRVHATSEEIEQRVRNAFARDLMTRDDDIAEELGVCFADIATLHADDAAHHELVFRNLALLTGLVPAHPAGTTERK